jgi:hypothetical protein
MKRLFLLENLSLDFEMEWVEGICGFTNIYTRDPQVICPNGIHVDCTLNPNKSHLPNPGSLIL